MLRRLVSGALVLQLAACGTILHPERKGQRGGNIDPGIAVLDAIGLLFFIIPGVVAFAVDFGNGTIYLPHTAGKTTFHATGELKKIQLDTRPRTRGELEAVVSRELGRPVSLAGPDVRVVEIRSLDEAALAEGVGAPNTSAL